MKMISHDFSNIEKKTIFDYGDDESLTILLECEGMSLEEGRERLTPKFFADADYIVRFQWLRGLADILQYYDPKGKELLSIAREKIDSWWERKAQVELTTGLIFD